MRNFQRDGHMRMEVPTGPRRVRAEQPRPDGPAREPGARLHARFAAADDRRRSMRVRAESFADHYSQARLFWRSMTEPEQRHIVNAFAFELGKVETLAIRRRMLGPPRRSSTTSSASGVGAGARAWRARPRGFDRRGPPIDLPPSPALSLVAQGAADARGAQGRRAGRATAAIATLVDRLRAAVEKEGARARGGGAEDRRRRRRRTAS